jgi:hypothetical protein
MISASLVVSQSVVKVASPDRFPDVEIFSEACHLMKECDGARQRPRNLNTEL